MGKRKWWLVVAAAALAALVLVLRLAGRPDVVPLKELPEIDHSAIDPFVEYEGAEIHPAERYMIVIRGEAKVDLVITRGAGLKPGRNMPVTVDRFMDGEKIDTVTASIGVRKPKLPSGYVHPENAGYPPPYSWDVQAGDKVLIMIDATTTTGRFDRLVIQPAGSYLPAGPDLE